MARSLTILVAEDDPAVRDLLAEVLGDGGYQVLQAEDGFRALSLLVQFPVDLLLTDINMPGMDGFELARSAKVVRPDLRVIYLSGAVTTLDSKGPVHGKLVQKPVRAAHLVSLVQGTIAPPGSPT